MAKTDFPAWFAPCGAVVGWLVGSLLRVRRAHVVCAMQRAGIPRAAHVASLMYRELGRGLFELLWLIVNRRQMTLPVELGGAVIGAASRGAVIATAHTGNWDLLACAAAQKVPLTVITKHFSIGWLDLIWQALRRRHGVALVRADHALGPVREALGRGECVAMLVDQAPERTRGTVACSFLGEIADVDLSPAWVALRARVPVLLILGRRLANGRLRAELVARFDPPARDRRRWAEATMRSITEHLEAFVKNEPGQWLWMHRRWKRG